MGLIGGLLLVIGVVPKRRWSLLLVGTWNVISLPNFVRSGRTEAHRLLFLLLLLPLVVILILLTTIQISCFSRIKSIFSSVLRRKSVGTSNLSSRRQANWSVHDISSVLSKSAAGGMVPLLILNVVVFISPLANWR